MRDLKFNTIDVKRVNRNEVFRYINYKNRISKPNIASALGLSKPTVLQIVNELLKEGLVIEAGEFESTGGRKPTAIEPIRNQYFAIGVDITEDHISIVLTDLSGELLAHKKIDFPYNDTYEYYEKLSSTVNIFIKEHSIRDKKILGVGFSIPGIIDEENQLITYSHVLNLRNKMCSEFTNFFDYKTIFINDANAAAVSEIYSREEKFDAVYLSLSNSVGGAIIYDRTSYFSDNMIENLLFKGDKYKAGEFGHMKLVPNGKTCYCGKDGCFDAYCNAKVLSNNTGGNLKNFFKKLDEGDESLNLVWEKYLNYLALHVNTLRMAFDSTVIIGGYVGSYIESYIGELRKLSSKASTFDDKKNFIIPCKYKIEASALGAALQLVEEFISKI